MKMKYRSFVFAGILACAAVGTNANAQQFYDNWNTDACGFTDRAGFDLHHHMRLTAIELWYRWGHHESEVRYELYQDGELIKRGHLMRASCDPYQESWCGARGEIGIDLPRGHVEVRTERAKVCQNDGSRGEGFIHAYGMRDHGMHDEAMPD